MQAVSPLSPKVFVPYSIPENPKPLDQLPVKGISTEAPDQADRLLAWYKNNISRIELLDCTHENLKTIAEQLLTLFNYYVTAAHPLTGAPMFPKENKDAFDNRVIELNELARYCRTQWKLVEDAHKHLDQVQKDLSKHHATLKKAQATLDTLKKVENTAEAIIAASLQLNVLLERRADGWVYGGRTSKAESAIAALQTAVWTITHPAEKPTGPIYRPNPAEKKSEQVTTAKPAAATSAWGIPLLPSLFGGGSAQPATSAGPDPLTESTVAKALGQGLGNFSGTTGIAPKKKDKP